MDDDDVNNAEVDSDLDNDLDVWLGQLNDLKEDLGGSTLAPPSVSNRKQITPSDTLDSFRNSVIQGVEDNEDIDLDALLGQLCAIESQLTTTSGEITDAIEEKEKPVPPILPQPTDEEPASGPIDISFLDADLADFSSEIDIVKMAFGISNDPANSEDFAEVKSVAPSSDCRPKHLPVAPMTQPNRDSVQSTRISQTGQQLNHGQNPVPSGHVLNSGQQVNRVKPVQHIAARSGQTVEEMDSLDDDDDDDIIVEPHTVQRAVSQSSQRLEVMDSRSLGIQDDSSCSDSMSLMSGSSGISGEGGHMVHDKVMARLDNYQQELNNRELSAAEQEQLLKQEKIKIAMEKIKEANIKKLFARIFAEDGSTKSIMADDTMTCRDVLTVVLDKSHNKSDICWALVEEIPELYMERVYEDHEMFVDNMLLWTADSVNKILLSCRQEIYDVFLRPEDYLLGPQPPASSLGEEARKQLLEDYFSSEGGKVPEVEGEVYVKAEGKKAWKKYYCVLRDAGIFFNPKGKGKSTKDLQILAHVEVMEIYHGVGWKKKYKAPTEHGFALKHPQIQKKSKFIKYLCVDDERSLRLWLTGLRIAKHGHQLYDNFKKVQSEVRRNQKLVQDNMRKSSKVNFSPPEGERKPPVAIVTGMSQSMNYSNFVDIDSNTTARIPLTTGTTRQLVRGGCSTSSSGDSGLGPDGFPPPPLYHEPDLDADFPPPPPPEDFPPPPPQLTPTPDIPPKSGHVPNLVAELRNRSSSRSGSKTSSIASSSSGGDYDNPIASHRSPRTSAMEHNTDHHFVNHNEFPDPPPVAKKPAMDTNSPFHGRQPPPVAKKPSPEPPPVAKKPKPMPPTRGDLSPVKPPLYHPMHAEPPRVAPKPTAAVNAVKPQPPPPPKRQNSDKAGAGVPANKAFLSNLENMIATKRTSVNSHAVNPERVSAGEMDLPPPPPELLEGLPPKTKKKPPPPPKRTS